MHEKILTLAKAIVRPAEEEEALLDALCTAAEAELAGRLREDVSPEDCGAFPCAGQDALQPGPHPRTPAKAKLSSAQ